MAARLANSKGKNMDPNAALAELRRLVIINNNDSSVTNREQAVIDARLDRMADLFEALDGWITRGGFLPTEWTQPAPVTA
jgi:hypothetical protein